MCGQVKNDDPKVFCDVRVVEKRPVLPSVGPGGVEAQERNACAGLFHIEPMRPAVDIKMKVAADGSFKPRRPDGLDVGYLLLAKRPEEGLHQHEVLIVFEKVAVDRQMPRLVHTGECLISAPGRRAQILLPGCATR